MVWRIFLQQYCNIVKLHILSPSLRYSRLVADYWAQNILPKCFVSIEISKAQEFELGEQSNFQVQYMWTVLDIEHWGIGGLTLKRNFTA